MISDWLSTKQKQSGGDYVITQGEILQVTIDDKKEQFLIQLGAKKGLFSSQNNTDAAEQYIVVTPGDKLVLQFGDSLQQQFASKPSTREEEPIAVMGGVDKVLHKIEQYTLANLSERHLKDQLGVPGSGGVLVTGAHGAGKTNVVHTILSRVKAQRIYTIEINCSDIADERIPVFKDMLQKWFDEAAWHGPSLVFFDDLDRLIPAEVEHADSTRSRHLAELFVRMALVACQRHPIMLIATAQQQQSLHPALITHHIFSELKHLQPPNRDERKLVSFFFLSFVLCHHSPFLCNIRLCKPLCHMDPRCCQRVYH